MVRFLPETVVLAIHDDQIRMYSGALGLHDAGALHMLQAQFNGQYLHATLYEMAAAYGFHLCQNHPFVDGNKRTAGMAMLTFLKLNDIAPTLSELDYYNAMMAVANGRMSKAELAGLLRARP